MKSIKKDMKWLDPETCPIPSYRTAIFYVKKVWIPPCQPIELLDTEVIDYHVIVGIYISDRPEKPLIDLTSSKMFLETDYYDLDDVIAWMPLPKSPNQKYEKDLEVERLKKENWTLRRLLDPLDKKFIDEMRKTHNEHNRKKEILGEIAQW
jgi:hypothetical protein